MPVLMTFLLKNMSVNYNFLNMENKYPADQNPENKNGRVAKEVPSTESITTTNEEVFICDECGDTLWDKVLEQENESGKL